MTNTPKITESATNFFYANAGYCQEPGQTPEQARRECAAMLATAEAFARAEGWDFVWEPEQEDLHFGDEHGRPGMCESLVVFGPDGMSLASLGCIDDADADYRRVCEGELALEAAYELLAEIMP